ncbi:Hypothetical predicted protein [Olea europaea subsp. europaea]|uniref:Uncharacterized protein n=1 Tax=Olea europaea subsp. europaea TaxID=158383 RepID=A0A8S0TUB9_OLEEU|nr:Hypothetical predicted protein [Olea europaea subsp. europaea]
MDKLRNECAFELKYLHLGTTSPVPPSSRASPNDDSKNSNIDYSVAVEEPLKRKFKLASKSYSRLQSAIHGSGLDIYDLHTCWKCSKRDSKTSL